MGIGPGFTAVKLRRHRHRGPPLDIPFLTATEALFLDLISVDAIDRPSLLAPANPCKIDWTYLLELAYREGMAPLVYRSLVETRLGSVGDIPVSKFHYLYLLTSRRNAGAYGQLQQLLQGLQSGGIDAIVLKGGALAEAVYHDIGRNPRFNLVMGRHDSQLVSLFHPGLVVWTAPAKEPAGYCRGCIPSGSGLGCIGCARS